jgi:hypothetical protein
MLSSFACFIGSIAFFIVCIECVGLVLHQIWLRQVQVETEPDPCHFDEDGLFEKIFLRQSGQELETLLSGWFFKRRVDDMAKV